jgi:hypothetical protein
MRQIKEVLRLKHQHPLSIRQIARSCGLAVSTVGDYLQRAQAAGLSWPVPETLTESRNEFVGFFLKNAENAFNESKAKKLERYAGSVVLCQQIAESVFNREAATAEARVGRSEAWADH